MYVSVVLWSSVVLVGSLVSVNGQGCQGLTYGPDCSVQCPCVASNTVACNQATGQCECLEGWEGENCDKDVNECTTWKHKCNTHIITECVNTDGGYFCRCREDNGYKDDGAGGCVRIECGGVYTDRSGIITSPNFPNNYFNYANCTYTIIVGKHDFFSVRFLNFELYQNDYCLFDYLEVFDAPTPTIENRIGRYCGTEVPQPILPKTNTLILRLITDPHQTYSGFRVSYLAYECSAFTYGVHCSAACTCIQDNTDYCDARTGQCNCKSGWVGDDCSVDIDECQNPLVCPHYSDCKNVGGSFECLCKPGLVQNAEGQCVAPSGESGCTGQDCSHVCVGSGSSQVCHCPIGMVYDGSKCVVCSALTYGPDCARTCSCDPRYTAECHHQTGTCECINGWRGENCTQDINECTERTHDCQVEPVSVCINTDGGYECKCLENNGYQQHESGKCVRIECGGTLTESSGIFTSPNHPEHYFNWGNCTWLITVPEGHVISLSFLNFDLEYQASCFYDYVDVHDGPSVEDRQIGRFCGTVPPETITSTTNNLFVRLRTDSTTTHTGFRASYTSQVKQAA